MASMASTIDDGERVLRAVLADLEASLRGDLDGAGHVLPENVALEIEPILRTRTVRRLVCSQVKE